MARCIRMLTREQPKDFVRRSKSGLVIRSPTLPTLVEQWAFEVGDFRLLPFTVLAGARPRSS